MHNLDQMNKEINEVNDSLIDYEEKLEEIQGLVPEDGEESPRMIKKGIDEDEMDDSEEPRFDTPETEYEQQFDQIIQDISTMILYKKDVTHAQIITLVSSIQILANQHSNQTILSQTKYCLETLFKGLIALLDIKEPRSALALSVSAISIFLRIFDKVTEKGPIVDKAESQTFGGLFSRLVDVVKVVFKHGKEIENDSLFEEEGVIKSLVTVIKVFFIQNFETVLNLTKEVVNNKTISKEDQLLDLMIYSIGSLKLVTQDSIHKPKVL